MHYITVQKISQFYISGASLLERNRILREKATGTQFSEITYTLLSYYMKDHALEFIALIN
jgi:hypothetical protein